MSDFREALTAAGSDADILAAVAHGVDPNAEAPTPGALAEWWPECPEAARIEAADLLRELARTCEPEAPGDVMERVCFFVYEGVVVRDGVTAEGPHLFGHWPTDTTGKVLGGGGRWISNPRMIDNLSRRWLEAEPRPRHPLAPIVRAWLAWKADPRNKRIARHRAADVRFPSALTQARDGFGTGDTLPPLAGTRAPGGSQYSLLPGLGPDYDEYSGEFLASVLPIELYTTRGKGAPLDIRIALEAIFDGIGRGRHGGRVPAVPWGHLLGRIYPGRKVAGYAKSAWPGLQNALDQLELGDQWRLPFANGKGGWEGWRVVVPNPRPLTGKPRERVGFTVTIPDTANPRHGSIHDRRMIAKAGALSTPALGLTSGLPVVWDRPGDTRREVGARDWEYVENPGAYSLMTLRGVVSLMYPGGPNASGKWGNKRWSEVKAQARALLEWLAGYRPVPGKPKAPKQPVGPQYIRVVPEPGGFRIAPGRDWPGFRAHQRKLIEAPK